jgi:hypothetical protein
MSYRRPAASDICTSALGQTRKYTRRADFFRFGPSNGHRSIGSAFPKRAMNGSRKIERENGGVRAMGRSESAGAAGQDAGRGARRGIRKNGPGEGAILF